MNNETFALLKQKLRHQKSQREDSFLNSPLYYLITGRKGASIYRDQDSLLITCHHPHIENRLMIFPEIGKADYSLTASVLDMVDVPDNGIQLARYTPQDIKKLKNKLSSLNYNYISDIDIIEEDVMDWRYPIRILDTKIVSEMKGNKYIKIRNKYKIASKTVTHEPLRKSDAVRSMKAALKFWEGNMIFSEKDTADMSEFYHEFFKVVENHSDSFDGMLFLQGRKPVGFSVWDIASDDTANSFINLGDLSVTGLSDYQMVTICRHLHDNGIRYLNTGGSELESLDKFKAKFVPAKTLDILSAELTYNRPTNPHIQMSTLVPS